MGNVAVAIVRRNTRGAKREVVADITGSASYATNGDSIVAADIAKLIPEGNPLSDVEEANFELGSGGHTCFLDRAAKKIKFFNGTTEIANAVNLSAVVVRVRLAYGQVTG